MSAIQSPGAGYSEANLVLLNAARNPYTAAGMQNLVAQPETATSWYKTQYGCLRTDPTAIARMHSFPDAIIPRGQPDDPAAPAKICMSYRTAWAQGAIDALPMVLTEQQHPQFAFRGGAPGTVYQIDMESQLRRLDQPLTNCQAVIPEDAPLHRNTVVPPPPTGVPIGPQNAANPIAAILHPGQADACRAAADQVATAMSGRWLNNPTRQDTMRFDRPFSPPGIGTGAARPPYQAGAPHYS